MNFKYLQSLLPFPLTADAERLCAFFYYKGQTWEIRMKPHRSTACCFTTVLSTQIGRYYLQRYIALVSDDLEEYRDVAEKVLHHIDDPWFGVDLEDRDLNLGPHVKYQLSTAKSREEFLDLVGRLYVICEPLNSWGEKTMYRADVKMEIDEIIMDAAAERGIADEDLEKLEDRVYRNLKTVELLG